MVFNKESEYENALVTILFDKGWERIILKNLTEQDLIDNWATAVGIPNGRFFPSSLFMTQSSLLISSFHHS